MKSVKEMRKRAGAGVAAMAMATAMMMSSMPVYAAGEGLDMSTAYPGVTVKAGDTVSFGLVFPAMRELHMMQSFQQSLCRMDGSVTLRVTANRLRVYT